MSSTATQYRQLSDPLGEVAASLGPDQWSRPSPCAGWSAADVLDHVLTTQRDFLADRGLELDTTDEQAPPAEAWRSHTTQLTRLLEDAQVAEMAYDGYFGPTTLGESLIRFYGFDMVVHRWDLARAAGGDTSFDEDELDLVEDSVAAFGEHLHMDGICGPEVPVDDDATRQERLLATCGRDPDWTAGD